VQMQRADRIGMRVSDEMLNGTLEDVAQRNGVTFSQLPEALRTQGIDYRDFREEIRRDLTLQMLRQRDVISRINVSPRELEQFIARQKNMPDQTSEYNLSHILVSVPQASSGSARSARQRSTRKAQRRCRFRAARGDIL
jgi:peptidyl-prolyl cis-trans isomerase SurA